MQSLRLPILVGLILLVSPLYAQEQTFLLVSSRNTNSVRMYDAETGEYMRDWAPPGIGGLALTQEVIYGPDGHVYVSGIETPVILKFDGMTGEFLGPFTSGYDLDSATKISWGPDGLMYVSQWGRNEGKQNVVRFNAETGEFVDEFTSNDPDGACDHLFDADGNMYLAVFLGKSVLKYDRDGNFLERFIPDNPLQGAVDLYWASNGDLMVVDWDGGRINRHDPETGDHKGIYISGMTNTEGVTIGPDGFVYAADWTENTINRYDALGGASAGIFIDESGGLQSPNALIFGPQAATTATDEEQPLDINLQIRPTYPNPTGDHTTIPFDLGQSETVALEVFDIQGRKVMTKPSQRFSAGSHTILLDLSALVPGQYVYSLETAAAVQSGVILRLPSR